MGQLSNIQNLNEEELKDYFGYLKTSIKSYSMGNVAKPISYIGTKQDYVSELICEKYQVKKEIKRRHNIFKRLSYLFK